MNQAPARLSLPAIWNMSFGFLGIQFGFGLQMANMSAIYQFLGAEEGDLPILWLAAPMTGLIVQPIIGYYSDRTWTRLGRRRPYFLAGAICASLALVAMPNSSTLWMAAGLLWVLDASVNISMEPFRAFVGDLLPEGQRKVGFAMQSLMIGLGAVLSSSLPWLLTNVFDVGAHGEASSNQIPWSVHLSFYIGAVVFLLAVLYTIVTTKERPPADMAAFEAEKRRTAGAGTAIKAILGGILDMPKIMQRLAVVQFFTWLGLFCMWLYFSPAIARGMFGGEPGSAAYQRGVEWGGVCFSTYNGVAFAFAFGLIALVRKFSARSVHAVCLVCGGLGLVSVGWWTAPWALLISMVGVGVAWASILALPYALLANALPAERMGFFMGVFNYFIVLPQILAATLLGPVVDRFFDGASMPVVMAGGVALLIAAVALLGLVPKDEAEVAA
ncbi:MFS transporter [Synoicihabitans lomoniglobus]|uniref:MFS transporter n=1 Tax=Synoicihabitans lomoniglobus TaxID=2909285 RepID=A0AAF0CR83_9BACT|nr:MFS transporter [Opitutaceae bacterium LMO-M01]WED66602.1 MFS transporter [Opitutaceae bacterium LMO-M01]